MTFRGTCLAAMLATFLSVATALPSYGLDIYEPDSRFDAAPNTAQTAAMFQSAETTAPRNTRGVSIQLLPQGDRDAAGIFGWPFESITIPRLTCGIREETS